MRLGVYFVALVVVVVRVVVLVLGLDEGDLVDAEPEYFGAILIF